MNIPLLFSVAAIIGLSPFPVLATHKSVAPSLESITNKVLAVNVRVPSSAARLGRRANTPYVATTTLPAASPVPVVTVPLPPPPSPVVEIPPPPPEQEAPAQVDVASQIEALIFSLSNTERQKNGLGPLIADSALAQIARSHSADMLANNYFSHTNLAGCSLSCRFAAARYSYASIGENIHWMSGYNLDASASAKKIVNDWMQSPGHRANILNGKFTNTGIGVAVKGSKIYSTTDFSLPR